MEGNRFSDDWIAVLGDLGGKLSRNKFNLGTKKRQSVEPSTLGETIAPPG
jgi:hypothetical protein